MSTKILKSLREVSEITSITKRGHKKVGLVFGAYDVLHMGHINLFRLAKKHVDILIIGLDNDQTIKLSKGKNRPINNYHRRSNFLSEITNVDYIFKIGKVFKHGDIKSSEYFERLYKKIQPTHIFTHSASDNFDKEKQRIAKSLGIKYIPDKTKTVTHSSVIIKKLESEL